MIHKIKTINPLIHHITNFVTANLCANATLAIGGSPLMADEEDEMREIAELSNSLVINLGTLNYRTLDSAIEAIDFYTQGGKSVVLDPVGVGASAFRTAALNELLRGGKISVIKGNAGEIASIIGVDAHSKGVDSHQLISEEFLQAASTFAVQNDLVLGVSGKEDFVLSKEGITRIQGGSPMCEVMTGAGCALSSVTAAFTSVLPAHEACIEAFTAYNLAATRASKEGPASFALSLIDELYKLDEEALQAAKSENASKA